MPTFVSMRGEWHGAKEKLALKNKSNEPIEYKEQTIQPGEDFIYDGIDREALKELHKSGNKNKDGDLVLGRDFTRDPDFLQSIRTQGFEGGEKGVKLYLNFIGYNAEEDKKRFEEQMETIKAHEAPKKVEAINILGGGKDFSGGNNNKRGNFGDMPN